MKCQARQMSDQMQCNACGLVWDMNDLDPPQCKPQRPLPGRNPSPTFAKPSPPPNPPPSAAERARLEVNAMLGTRIAPPQKYENAEEADTNEC